MKLHARRVTSALCALAMLVAMLPSTAWAEDSTTESTSTLTQIVETANENEADTNTQQGDTEGGQQGDTEGGQQGDTEGTQQGGTEGTQQGGTEGAQQGGTEGIQQGDTEGTQQGDTEGAQQGDTESTQQGGAEGAQQGGAENAQQGSIINSEPGTSILYGNSVIISEEYTITNDMDSNDIKAVLSKAKANNQPAKICAGSYEGNFTVESITLYVEGEVHLAKSISLKNATLQGVTGRNTDKVLIQDATSAVVVNGAMLQNMALEISGSVHNYLLHWESGNFVVNDAYLSASGNTNGSGLYANGKTAGSKFTATNSILHFDSNVQGQGGAGIWSNSDGNANVEFEFTGCTVTMNNNGLNGFLGQPAPYFGSSVPKPRFTFTNTNVEATGNGSPTDGGEGDGFSYGYITLKNTDGGNYTFDVSNNDNNGLDGGRQNNAALNAQGYIIRANNNGNIGINVSRLNANTSACTLIDCTVEANDNGSYGIQLLQPAEITNTSITTNKNGNSGIRFYAYSGSLLVDGTSSLTTRENEKSGLYFYGQEATLNGAFISQQNQDSGLYIGRGSVAVNNSNSIITNNTSSQYGGGIRNAGYFSATSVTLVSGVQLYNNHADKAGDDLYNAQKATATLCKVGSNWVLDDCHHNITGWYDDAEENRWNVDDSTRDIHADEFAIPDDPGTAIAPALTALKAAHGLYETKVEPADIIIYMGGSSGYDGVADENGVISGSNSLPEPGFYFDLPQEVNEAFAAVDLSQPANLSNYITIDYDNPEDERHWVLEQYGATASVASNRFIYRIKGTDEDKPFRLNFTSEDGANVYKDDDFNPAELGALSSTYTMKIYNELVDDVIITVTVPEGNGQPEKVYRCKMTPLEGALTVRYVTTSDQGSVVTSAQESAAAASKAEDPSQTALKNAYVIPQAGTQFFINESTIDVTAEAAPSLLFDEIVTNSNTEGVADYHTALTDRAVTEVASDFQNPQYEAKYLNLVDANNGNVWLKPSQEVTVYWPYPEGTDEHTTFRLAHFVGMDRDMATDDVIDVIQNAEPLSVANVKTDEYGIYFTTQSFSPYVLLWDEPTTEGSSEQPTATPTPAPTVKPEVTPTPAPMAAVIPQTGDNSQPMLWGALVLVSGAALAMLAVYRKKRSNK